MTIKLDPHDSRFSGIEPFASKLWLASPTMHGDEQRWVQDAFDKNWITTAGENINEVEIQMAEPWDFLAERLHCIWRSDLPEKSSMAFRRLGMEVWKANGFLHLI